jgi:hypothetical protein
LLRSTRQLESSKRARYAYNTCLFKGWSIRRLSPRLGESALAQQIHRRRGIDDGEEVEAPTHRRCRSPRGARVRPEHCQVELDGIEGLGAHPCIVFERREQQPTTVSLLHDLECAGDGVYQPNVANAGGGIEGQLAHSVEPGGGRAKDFADPIGSEREKALVPHERQPFPAPTREVGHQHVRGEMQLGPKQDEPASRAAAAALERRAELFAERRGRGGVSCARRGRSTSSPSTTCASSSLGAANSSVYSARRLAGSTIAREPITRADISHPWTGS